MNSAGFAEIEIEDRVAEPDVIGDLLLVAKARSRNIRLAIVTNRTRLRTKAVEKRESLLWQLNIPVLSRISDTRFYASAAEKGGGIHELAGRGTRKDIETWEELLGWLNKPPEEFGFIPDEQIRNVSG